MLTSRQFEILECIRRYQRENGVTPTVAEIQEKFGFKSPTAVSDHLAALERKGVIWRVPGTARNIRLVEDDSLSNQVSIPFLGAVPAGYASVVTEERDLLYLDLGLFGLKHSAVVFALRVRGDSMVNAGIFDGDIAIIEASNNAAEGDVVAATIDGETTLKRFCYRGGLPFLRAENPKYPELIPSRELRVQGIFRALVRTAKV